MPKNLEIKVKLTDHRHVKSILRKNKIELTEVLYQKDIYYSVKSGLLKLRIENGHQTLIFYQRNEKAKNRWSDYHLLEIEGIDGNKYFSRFLDVLAIVEKKRDLFLFNNTRIHLDKVKGLGSFLELETRVINGLADAKKRFLYIYNLLELNDKEELRTSYRNLLLEKKRT